jgi:hypothetical protein
MVLFQDYLSRKNYFVEFISDLFVCMDIVLELEFEFFENYQFFFYLFLSKTYINYDLLILAKKVFKFFSRINIVYANLRSLLICEFAVFELVLFDTYQSEVLKSDVFVVN